MFIETADDRHFLKFSSPLGIISNKINQKNRILMVLAAFFQTKIEYFINCGEEEV
jgi:hypothetical protein